MGKLLIHFKYISKIKNNKFWMVDIEIAAVNIVDNTILFLF